MKAWRIILVAAGIGLGLFGAFRLLTQIPVANLVVLAVWLAAAIVIHDGLLSPAVVGLGWLLRRHVPDRGRRHLQVALVVAGMVTVVAVPMIVLRGSQPPAKALLLQNYGLNLTVLLALVAVVTLALYAVRVARDRERRRRSSPLRGL